MQARLLPLFDALPTGEAHRLPTLRATVLELMAVFAQEYEAGLERERLSMTGKVENLERRIHKLMKTLEETEDVLARVAQMKNLEVGIESIYRTVQGLNPAEADRELKLALMKTIFEANLEMRGSMAV